MNMVGACWMTRLLGEPVSALSIDESNDIIAGGWNGVLSYWDCDGENNWSTNLPDRIGSIASNQEFVFATAGLHIVAVSRTSGELMWQFALEGSADEVIIHEGHVYATSSVYDIEHNDFIDSAVWCFTFDGNNLWTKHMDERPWTIFSDDNTVIIGLGRPKMGIATINQEGEINHQQLASNSPVTFGKLIGSKPVFGHANGDVSSIDGKITSIEGESIEEVLTDNQENLVIVTERSINCLTNENSQLWSMKNIQPSGQAIGFEINNIQSFWYAKTDVLNGQLKIIYCDSGQQIAAMSCSKISNIVSSSNRVVVGNEAGEILVWDAEMLNRRLESEVDIDQDDRKKALRDRLKALKKR
jgi:hypothetical protein